MRQRTLVMFLALPAALALGCGHQSGSGSSAQGNRAPANYNFTGGGRTMLTEDAAAFLASDAVKAATSKIKPYFIKRGPAPSFDANAPATVLADGSFSYKPADIRRAYGLDQLPQDAAHTGAGQVIAIVDAYGSPTAMADLDVFSQTFGLPPAAQSLTIVNPPHGQKPDPNSPTAPDWGFETSLDVQWVHAIAPNAQIRLYVAENENDLPAAVARASGDDSVNQISMSWGADEQYFTAGALAQVNAIMFDQPDVTYSVSSGDNGYGASWPAQSARALAVGGTSLFTDAANKIDDEFAWNGSGGAPSAFEPAPGYQAATLPGAKTRSIPDVSLDADPYTGYLVYDSSLFPGSDPKFNWFVVGGTSASAPAWAAMVAIANGQRKTPFNHIDPFELQTTLYGMQNATLFRDTTVGCFNHFPQIPYFAKKCAGVGYDQVTGIGTPHANLLIPKLVGG